MKHDDDAASAETRAGKSVKFRLTRWITDSWPPWLRIAAAAYVVVALLGLAYLVVSAAWPSLGSAATATVAGLIAAPLALGLLWPRLTGFKGFGIEVSLAQITVSTDTSLAAVIMSRDMGSAAPDLVTQMQEITKPGVELLEIDLRDGQYWWSTRLYLLAAVAHDLSDVRTLAFVHEPDRRFVGMAAPAIIRRALATETPELETTYLAVAAPAPVEDPASRVQQIVFSWTARSFGPQATLPEGDFATRVSPDTLRAGVEKIGRRLNTDSIDWPGYADPRITTALVRHFDGDYVALIRHGSLDRIVNRHALAAEIASRTA